jgi:iron complex transport system substrate-binding protein
MLNDADMIGYYSDYSSSAPTNDGPQLFAQDEFKALSATKANRLGAFPDFLPGGYGDALAVLTELQTGLKALAS